MADTQNKNSSGEGRGWHGDPEGHARAGEQSHKNDNKSSGSSSSGTSSGSSSSGRSSSNR